MASILFAGGRLESLTTESGAPYDYTDNDARWDSTYSDAGLLTNGGVVSHLLYDDSMAAISVGAGHTFYYHFQAWMYTFNAAAILTIYNSDLAPWLRLYVVQDTLTCRLQYNSGTAASPVWTQLGSDVSFTNVANNTVDLAVVMPSSGAYTATMYVGGTATAATGSFTSGVSSGQPSAYKCALGGTGAAPNFSQLLATMDQSTIGAKVKTCRATGAGSNSEWTGTYTDVNSAGDNDTTANATTTADVVQTYPVTNVTAPTGLQISAVFHWLRARNNGASPSNIASVVRSGGTNYVSATLSGISTSFSALGMRYDTDPSTSAPWTQSGFNTPAQFGFKSLT